MRFEDWKCCPPDSGVRDKTGIAEKRRNAQGQLALTLRGPFGGGLIDLPGSSWQRGR
jgi:hypothetical protein